jgi:hypothetical protein
MSAIWASDLHWIRKERDDLYHHFGIFSALRTAHAVVGKSNGHSFSPDLVGGVMYAKRLCVAARSLAATRDVERTPNLNSVRNYSAGLTANIWVSEIEAILWDLMTTRVHECSASIVDFTAALSVGSGSRANPCS